jgi:hypothetical protein
LPLRNDDLLSKADVDEDEDENVDEDEDENVDDAGIVDEHSIWESKDGISAEKL